jgi:hypothetical protein
LRPIKFDVAQHGRERDGVENEPQGDVESEM